MEQQDKINKVIEYASKQPNSQFYLKNDKLLPKPDLRFAAIKNINIAKVVILGQDPYPRERSACGIAFLDNAITSFQDKAMAPSLKNLLKCLLIDKNYLHEEDTIDEMRAKMLKVFKSQKPQDFFNSLQNQGFMFLNTSLTFENDQTTQQHCKWWAPTISKIIQLYTDKNTVFVLMGNYAQNYYKQNLLRLSQINQKRVIKTIHPVMQTFPQSHLFRQLDQFYKDIDYFN